MTTALAPPAAATPPTSPPLTVLIQHLHRLLDLRDADTDAAASLAGLPPLRLRPAHPGDAAGSPFRLASLRCAEDADRLLERAILIKVWV